MSHTIFKGENDDNERPNLRVSKLGCACAQYLPLRQERISLIAEGIQWKRSSSESHTKDIFECSRFKFNSLKAK